MDDLTPEQIERRQIIDTLLGRFDLDLREHVGSFAGAATIPRRLYHYTTLDGLTGIVGSTGLWASDVRFVNDASELSYASKLIGDEVVAAISKSETVRSHLHLHPEMANPFEIGARPFVACFCEEGDLLSQWRGYRADESGFSLGFDLTGQTAFGPPNTLLRKVIYDPDEQRDAVRKVVKTWLHTAVSLLAGETDADALFPYPAIWALERALAEHHLCFKNPAFAEEREWRLIKLVDIREEFGLQNDRRTSNELSEAHRQIRELDPSIPPREFRLPERRAEGVEIRFRRTPLGLVPFVELPVPDTAGLFTGRLPLWEVIQGPTISPALSLESLGLYLESFGYVGTEVMASEIPLRA